MIFQKLINSLSKTDDCIKMLMFPIILHSYMCGFMTLAPMHLEASCRFRCDDENGSAPDDRAVHSAVEIIISW